MLFRAAPFSLLVCVLLLNAFVPGRVHGCDTIPPEITCPANITANASQAGGSVLVFEASATDDELIVDLSCTPPSGSLFPLGTTPVECSATDECGNTASCVFQVEALERQLERRGCTGRVGCGDGLLDVDEVCDDGNNLDGDGCQADCTTCSMTRDGGLAQCQEACATGCFDAQFEIFCRNNCGAAWDDWLGQCLSAPEEPQPPDSDEIVANSCL